MADPQANVQGTPVPDPQASQQGQKPQVDSQGKDATPQAGVQGKAPEKPNNDILTRVNEFIQRNPPASSDDDGFKFDSSEIEKIEDPKTKELVEGIYKSFQSGMDKKFKEVAELRNTLQEQIKQGQTATSGTQLPWTTDRVQSLLQDPSFIQAASQVSGLGADDDDSNLSDKDRQAMASLQEQNRQLTQQVQALSASSSNAMRVQEDEVLKSRYEGYNPKAVDTLTGDLLQNRVKASREHLWKVLDYDEMVKRMENKIRSAYNIGRTDERNGVQENVQAASIEGMQTVPNEDVPKKEKGESSQSYFVRLGLRNLARTKRSGATRS